MLITLPNAFGDAATNMAIDAALLESLPKGLAAFRHYGWIEPSITFGYSQGFKEVQSLTTETTRGQSAHPELTLCRRLTGGGIVDHRNDWTYALILHSALSAAGLPATELYKKIHQAIHRVLRAFDVSSSLAPCPRHCETTLTPKDTPSQCFVSPAANDLLRADGRKIAGAAMKRNRHGLLIQGSLDRGAMPDAFEFINFQHSLVETLAEALELPPGQSEDLRSLFKSKPIEAHKKRFRSRAWNEKR